MSEESKPSQLVGLVGEFTDHKGRVCQCVVTGRDKAPWDKDCLIITYVHPDGRKITGAMIGVNDFRPDMTGAPKEG